MKLSEKKVESSNKKVQSIETARKAAPKSAASKPPRPKKAEVQKKPVSKKAGEASLAWLGSAREYLREVVVELKKVIWPSRKETVGSTAVVLVIVGLAAVFLGVVDLVLSRLVKLLVG
jgi:preprotein translocase subunit SecE